MGIEIGKLRVQLKRDPDDNANDERPDNESQHETHKLVGPSQKDGVKEFVQKEDNDRCNNHDRDEDCKECQELAEEYGAYFGDQEFSKRRCKAPADNNRGHHASNRPEDAYRPFEEP